MTAATRKAVKDRIERAYFKIMRHSNFCAWAGLLYVGKWELDDNIPTACVDMQNNVKYGTDFMAGFKQEGGTDLYVNFVILHEQGHKAFLHTTQGQDMFKENPQLANIAADYVVNLALFDTDPEEKFQRMPRDAQGKREYWFDEKYRGWSMREIFNDLKKQAKKIGMPQGTGKGMDEHQAGEGDNAPTPEEQEQIKKQVENALRQGQYIASKMGGKGARRLVGDVLAPKVDWREEMMQFLQDSFTGDDYSTWRKPMRRFVGMDTYLPTTYSEELGELVAAVDTSMSTGEKETVAWTSEIFHLCRIVRPSKLRLLYWGSEIVGEEIYTPDMYDTMLSTTKPVCGGGTTVHPVAEYVKKHKDVQAAIILTDGELYDGFGEWSVPTLWVITGRSTSPVGKTIRMEV
jgi:predicted metal-dependent peptidase